LTNNLQQAPISKQQAKERIMAAKDAEMPAHHPLGEEVEEITKHLAALRKDMDKLGAVIGRAGGHQVERAQDAMNDAVAAVEASVRQNPISALGIALGVGFLFGVILRR
jgi:ElaB/YqjD/DUF883 family membrane-anchored ribosome-binding protein